MDENCWASRAKSRRRRRNEGSVEKMSHLRIQSLVTISSSSSSTSSSVCVLLYGFRVLKSEEKWESVSE